MNRMYEIIKSLCEEQGISIAELSRRVQIRQGLFSDLKKNENQVLKAENLKKIADYFCVPMEFFFSDGEPSTRDIPSEPEISDSQLIFALWKDNPNNMTKDDLERVRSFAKYIEQEKGEKN